MEAEDGADKTVTWTTSDSSKAKFVSDSEEVETVTGDSATVKALAVTETPVEIIATAGDQKATYKLTIVADPSDKDAAVQAAVLSAIAGTYTVTVGDADPLTVVFKADGKVYAEDGTKEIGTLTFDEDGNVVVAITDDEETYTIAVTDGTADITKVTGSNGSTVTVAKKASENQGNGEEPKQETPAQKYSHTYDFAKDINKATEVPSGLVWLESRFSKDGNLTTKTAVDYYYKDGLYLATSQNGVWLRGNKSALTGKEGPVAYTANAIKGPFSGSISVGNTNDTNTGRKIEIYIGADKATLFSGTAVVSKEIKGQSAQSVSFDYTETDSVYVGVKIVSDMLYISSLTITDAASDFATVDDDALVLAFAKADWDTLKTENLSQYAYTSASYSAYTTALQANPSGDAYAPYLAAAQTVYTAKNALVKYVAPDTITVSYDGKAVVAADGLQVNFKTLTDGTIALSAKETAGSDSATAGMLTWSLAQGTDGLDNASVEETTGKITGITGAGKATVTVTDATVRTKDTDGKYTATTTEVTATFVLEVTNVDVTLQSTDTVTASTQVSGLNVTLSAVVKHAGATEAADDFTEDLVYTWYKGENANDTTPADAKKINLTNDVYATSAASTYYFFVVVTSGSNATGITSAVVSATTSAKPALKQLDSEKNVEIGTNSYTFEAKSGLYIDKAITAYGANMPISIAITISGKAYSANTSTNNIYCGFTKTVTDLETSDCAYSGTKGVAKPKGKALNAAGGNSNHTAVTGVADDEVVTITMTLSPTSKKWIGTISFSGNHNELTKNGDETLLAEKESSVDVYPFVYSAIASTITSITVTVGSGENATTYSY